MRQVRHLLQVRPDRPGRRARRRWPSSSAPRRAPCTAPRSPSGRRGTAAAPSGPGAARVPVGAADRVHHDQAVVDADVPLRAGADQRPGAGVHHERPVRAALGDQQPAQRGQRGHQRWALHGGVQARWMTKLAPSPRPISSASTRLHGPRVLLVGDVEGRVGGADRLVGQGGQGVGQRRSVDASRTCRHSSGAPSSTQAKPRSVICRYGTRASVRAPGAPGVSGMSASRSTVSTGPVNSSSSSAPSRRSRAKGPGSTTAGDGGEQVGQVGHRGLRRAGRRRRGGHPDREIRRPPRWRPRGWSYARKMAAGSAGHQLVRCASM